MPFIRATLAFLGGNMQQQSSFVENESGHHKDDFYRTPAPCTQALVDELKRRGIEPRTILDVGCGDGAIGRVLK
jgi:predicted RNA methylase